MKIIQDKDNPVPQAIFEATVAQNSTPPKNTSIRVTELIDSPNIRQLTTGHWYEIEIPVSRLQHSLRGTFKHAILSQYAPKDSIPELPLLMPLSGDLHHGVFWSLSGTADLWTPSIGLLEDYKETSLWTFLSGVKKEWIRQINVYAWMLGCVEREYRVKQAKIHMLLREWTPSSAARKKDYPQSGYQTIEIPLWSEETAREYVKSRIIAHSKFCYSCTDEERWVRPTKYAVMKKGMKKAVRVLDTTQDAAKYLEKEKLQGPKFYVEERKGGFTRCELYCHVADFCSQWQKEKEDRKNETGEEDRP
jgi:hypothetical protein